MVWEEPSGVEIGEKPRTNTLFLSFMVGMSCQGRRNLLRFASSMLYCRVLVLIRIGYHLLRFSIVGPRANVLQFPNFSVTLFTSWQRILVASAAHSAGYCTMTAFERHKDLNAHDAKTFGGASGLYRWFPACGYSMVHEKLFDRRGADVELRQVNHAQWNQPMDASRPSETCMFLASFVAALWLLRSGGGEVIAILCTTVSLLFSARSRCG